MSLTIAQLAQAGGVGVETVRYYQRRGLLDTPDRVQGHGQRGGIRRYGETDVRKLCFVRSAQAAGFTLEEIGELIALDATRDRERARALAKARIAALDTRIDQLMHARIALHRLERDCASSDVGPCPILTAFEGRAEEADDACGRDRKDDRR